MKLRSPPNRRRQRSGGGQGIGGWIRFPGGPSHAARKCRAWRGPAQALASAVLKALARSRAFLTAGCTVPWGARRARRRASPSLTAEAAGPSEVAAGLSGRLDGGAPCRSVHAAGRPGRCTALRVATVPSSCAAGRAAQLSKVTIPTAPQRKTTGDACRTVRTPAVQSDLQAAGRDCGWLSVTQLRPFILAT